MKPIKNMTKLIEIFINKRMLKCIVNILYLSYYIHMQNILYLIYIYFIFILLIYQICIRCTCAISTKINVDRILYLLYIYVLSNLYIIYIYVCIYTTLVSNDSRNQGRELRVFLVSTSVVLKTILWPFCVISTIFPIICGKHFNKQSLSKKLANIHFYVHLVENNLVQTFETYVRLSFCFLYIIKQGS